MAEPTENSLTTETVIQQGQVLAGPLIRDLRLRGLIERVLVVCPANLSIQWQREQRRVRDQRRGPTVGSLSSERSHDSCPLADGSAHRGIRSVSHLPSGADPMEAEFKQRKERARS